MKNDLQAQWDTSRNTAKGYWLGCWDSVAGSSQYSLPFNRHGGYLSCIKQPEREAVHYRGS